MMDIKIESKMVIETTVHFHNGRLKTHPCEVYDWWGNDKCKEVNFNSEIEKVMLPEGEYKVTITLEKINE